MNLKSIAIGTAAAAILLGGAYAYADWDVIQLKYGLREPLIISYDQYGEKPIRIELTGHRLGGLQASMTDLYYLPQSRELHYAIWYSKRDKDKAALEEFEVEFKSSTGAVSSQSVAAPSHGLLDYVQQRRNEDIPLLEGDTLQVRVTSIQRDGDAMTRGESAYMTLSLPAGISGRAGS